MTIFTDYGFRFVSLHEIQFVEKTDDKHMIHLTQDKTIEISEDQFKDLKELTQYPFVRVSAICIVNQWYGQAKGVHKMSTVHRKAC